MFTGIVQATGRVARSEAAGGDLRLTVDAAQLAARIDASRLAVGESVAVSGVCLTVTAFDGGRFTADVSRETLALTTLGRLRPGDGVNLEAALRAGRVLVRPHARGAAAARRASQRRELRRRRPLRRRNR